MKIFIYKSQCAILCLILWGMPQYTVAQDSYEQLMTESLQSENFQLPDNVDPKFMEAVAKYLELAGEIDAAYGALVQNCNDNPIPLDKVELCQKTAQNIVEAQKEMEGPLLATVENLLLQYEETCAWDGLTEIGVEGLGDVVNSTSEILLQQCLRGREGVASETLNCAKEVACSIASTITLSGLWGANSDSYQRECLSAENDCLTQLLTTLASLLVSSINGVWNLLKMGGGRVAEQGRAFWDWVTDAEDETSENQEMLQNLSDEDIDDIKQDSKSWMSRMLSGITSMIGEWLRTDILCEEWEGTPHFSECRQPLQAWKCLECGTMINAICSFGGIGVGLIVETFLSGGVFGAISKAVKGASIGVTSGSVAAKVGITAMKPSLHYAKLTQHLGKVSFFQQVVNMSKRMGRGAIAKTGKILVTLLKTVGKSTPVLTARSVRNNMKRRDVGSEEGDDMKVIGSDY